MPAKSIEIVTHCYCPPGVDEYAEHLKWQYASLKHWTPKVPVQLTVFYSADDRATCHRIAKMSSHEIDGVRLCIRALGHGELFRRAVGRNYRALFTKCDVIWFTDVDYSFGEGCLDAVAEHMSEDSGLRLPQTIHINTDHQVGHDMVVAAKDDDWPRIDPTKFSTRRQKVAIGGVQIIGRKFANRIGYLHGTKWVQPVDPKAGFRSCKCDKAWRSHNKLSSKRLPIPNCYRIRHTRDGRDYTIDGTLVGTEVW